jgi:uncharacterized protein
VGGQPGQTPPSKTYPNPNFRWFKERYESFVYIDRVIVAPDQRGRGVASMLYRDLIARSEEAHQPRIVREVNIDPPNPASLAFHAALGFEMVGEASISDGKRLFST